MNKINKKNKILNAKGIINHAGKVREEKIIKVIEQNYMPYAMSVIMSRAIPEIDGFKPSQRKLLYTMYKMGLLGSARTKSANIVGQTMKLNPHGDGAIYETMARMTRGYEALPHPYIDSKGNFGKFYSRDMARAASRYTEARLDVICREIFADIDKNTVDFIDNYDNTLLEPALLPVHYPSILVNAGVGIAVGMASSVSPFNLREVCKTAVCLIKNKNFDISKTLIAPDFPGGGEIIYEKEKIDKIYKTGRGGLQVRARYGFDKSSNCIDINHIPSTTTSEAIIEKIAGLAKQGKLNEISDVRDETGISGLKITIDLKRGTDYKRVMYKLFKLTPLQDSFNCNFNVLVNGTPKVFGVKDLILEWIDFRTAAVRRRTEFDLNKKKEKFHLLLGLSKILLDIDKAIKIIRETKEELLVIPNLMSGFNIDEIQAEFVAEIKLRNLNKEYILKKTNEMAKLKNEICNLEEILQNENRLKQIIIEELEFISKTYGKSRMSPLKKDFEEEYSEEENPGYSVIFFFTKEGYFKKITPQSLRMSSEHQLKNGDEITQQVEGNNSDDLLFFTNFGNVYKIKASVFQDTKSSMMGEFVGAKLETEENEECIYMAVTSNYEGFMLFFFSDGKVSKIKMNAYQTKTNRKKLINAYSVKSPLRSCFYIKKDSNFTIFSSSGKTLTFNTELLDAKSVKSSQGTSVMKLKKGHDVTDIKICSEDIPQKFFVKKLPSAGQNFQKIQSENN